ncbi:MAG: radical SAM protein [Candidatus Wallbacteria bacterium]|nr:radical SAM protein [Candidatus Wallbacteria bacterium]
MKRFIRNLIKRTGYYFMPGTVYAVINGECNLRCSMCDIGKKNADSDFYRIMKGGEDRMTLDDFRRLAREIRGCDTFHIVGTEPLLHPDIREIIQAFSSEGIKVSLTTNGFLLPEKYPLIMGASRIYLSVDGLSEIHDRIRGVKGSFDKIVEGLTLVAGRRQERGEGPSIHLSITVTDENCASISLVVKYFTSLPVDGIHIEHLNFRTREMAELHNKCWPALSITESCIDPGMLDRIDTDALFTQLEQVKNLPGVEIHPPLSREQMESYYREPLKIVGNPVCDVPFEVTQILANGDVVPLTRCFDLRLGNVRSQNFRSIWNSRNYRKLRRLMFNRKYLPGCARCCGLSY